jgi:hypothetical protein
MRGKWMRVEQEYEFYADENTILRAEIWFTMSYHVLRVHPSPKLSLKEKVKDVNKCPYKQVTSELLMKRSHGQSLDDDRPTAMHT